MKRKKNKNERERIKKKKEENQYQIRPIIKNFRNGFTAHTENWKENNTQNKKDEEKNVAYAGNLLNIKQ